jgi:RNA-binding protein 5/10
MSSTLAAAKSTAAPTVAEPAKVKAPTPPLDADMHFSDITGKICLLCARQFKTPEMTTRHAKESDLHKVGFENIFRGNDQGTIRPPC